MAIDIEAVKKFCRIDFDEDDADVLAPMIIAAENVVIGGTKTDVDQEDDRFKLAVMIIVNDWFNNRGESESEIPIGAITLMTQLAVS